MSQTWNPPIADDDPVEAVTTKVQGMLDALRVMHRGNTAPTVVVPGMLWAQPSTGVIWERNAADTAWMPFAREGGDQTRQALAAGTFALSATTTILLPTRHDACVVKRVILVSDTATASSDGTNRWEFNVRNVTQSEDLLAADVATDTAEIAANVPFVLTPDQNDAIAADDVLRLEVTKTGSPTSPLAQVLVMVEYGLA